MQNKFHHQTNKNTFKLADASTTKALGIFLVEKTHKLHFPHSSALPLCFYSFIHISPHIFIIRTIHVVQLNLIYFLYSSNKSYQNKCKIAMSIIKWKDLLFKRKSVCNSFHSCYSSTLKLLIVFHFFSKTKQHSRKSKNCHNNLIMPLGKYSPQSVLFSYYYFIYMSISHERIFYAKWIFI